MIGWAQIITIVCLVVTYGWAFWNIALAAIRALQWAEYTRTLPGSPHRFWPLFVEEAGTHLVTVASMTCWIVLLTWGGFWS